MRSDKLLMVFVRNPELGKVKTRLAETMGEKKALEVYHNLLRHTNKIASSVSADKSVFYSNFIDDYDTWSNVTYTKYVQEGEDLGSRMENAFKLNRDKGYDRIIIIGSDCLELSTPIIDNAFELLENNDVVIGPARDGGYYLLGMKKMHHAFFTDKKWSSENVFLDTLLDVERLGLSYSLLDTLSDVDYEEDLTSIKV